MTQSIFNKTINKKTLLGAAIGASMALSVATPAFAGCGGYNPCRGKVSASKHNPCAGNPCAGYNPCAAKNPCAGHNPCAAAKSTWPTKHKR